MLAVAIVAAMATSIPRALAATGDWTVYHGDAAGAGVAPGVSVVDTASRAWTSPGLDGQIYGEPLVDAGTVFVATEHNTVYALSGATGAIVWSRHIAPPVPASALPCGDIAPTVGITGTPVIDPVRGELFVVADEFTNGRPQHVLVGLASATGALELSEPVDPPDADPAALLQRTGLALDAGKVIFGMGGNFGDCATYRGRVVAVGEAGGTPAYFTVDAAPGQTQGAIWMGGAAPVVDAHGNVWVSAGNGSVTSASEGYDDSDSALELTPSMHLVGYFAPTSWPEDNANDRDMSIAPALLASGQVVLAGKSGIAFLLDGARPGGIGGQQARLVGACAGNIEGGATVLGTTVVLPCASGPVAVRVTAPAGLGVQWRASVGGGPPIAAAGLVWTIGQDGVLYGLDPATGAVRQTASIGAVANHFPTPSVGDGLLVAPTANRVVAYRASAAPAPAAKVSTPPKGPTSSSSGGGSASGPVWGLVAGAVVALAVIAVLVRRRRRQRQAATGRPG